MAVEHHGICGILHLTYYELGHTKSGILSSMVVRALECTVVILCIILEESPLMCLFTLLPVFVFLRAAVAQSVRTWVASSSPTQIKVRSVD